MSVLSLSDLPSRFTFSSESSSSSSILFASTLASESRLSDLSTGSIRDSDCFSFNVHDLNQSDEILEIDFRFFSKKKKNEHFSKRRKLSKVLTPPTNDEIKFVNRHTGSKPQPNSYSSSESSEKELIWFQPKMRVFLQSLSNMSYLSPSKFRYTTVYSKQPNACCIV